MDAFDLNIKNYSVIELEELLSLGRQYNPDEIRYKKNNICMKIADDDTISFDMKSKLENFFDKVSVLLNNSKQKSVSNNDSKDSKDDTKVDNFSDLKNDMMKNTNNLIISDPYAARNIKVDPLTSTGLNVESYGTQIGVINPLLTNTILKGVSIDTRFRENYYSTKSTNLHITLPFRLENVIAYRIVGITLPLTYYNISQSYGNNVMQINIISNVSGTVGVSYNLILPDGCYNTLSDVTTYSSSLEQVINDILTNDPNSPNNNPLCAGLNLYYTINRTSGRSIFAQDVTIATTIAYNFEIIMNVGYNVQSGSSGVDEDYSKVLMLKMGWIFGFRLAEYTSSNSSPPTSDTNFGSIVSEGICFTKNPLYGFLAIDDYNNNSNDYYTSVFSNSLSLPNIVAKVNLTQFSEGVGDFQTAQGESTSNAINREKRFFGPVNIQKLKVTIYDDLGRILDLNNMDWNLELAFECVYKM
uniref:Uncharacterized protein n=1 Tax=viral metagenome TaxID=1070528 RepID=A0A6C0EZL9_9ZZZZ